MEAKLVIVTIFFIGQVLSHDSPSHHIQQELLEADLNEPKQLLWNLDQETQELNPEPELTADDMQILLRQIKGRGQQGFAQLFGGMPQLMSGQGFQQFGRPGSFSFQIGQTQGRPQSGGRQNNNQSGGRLNNGQCQSGGSTTTQPIENRPITTQPIGNRPITTQPIGNRPIGTTPIGTTNPTVTDPSSPFIVRNGKAESADKA